MPAEPRATDPRTEAQDPTPTVTQAPAPDQAPTQPAELRPWPALWSMIIGFFMLLVDGTIVSIATPRIQDELDADITKVIWVTSAYLLAYAVPLLVTGRLGDRLGPKRVYLAGLVVFTLASLWCGLSGTIEMLIVARVVQGLGAALMTPQTMTVITRMFPPQQRGPAMALWGATAGVANLVGPILGGVLVDGLGWEWIFFVNVPVGIVGFVLAMRLVPNLESHAHRFDLPGVLLSAVGMFLVVFGIQEGSTYDWGTITGIISVPLLIGAGIVVLVLFVLWQAKQKGGEPLLPLGLFRDRNFAVANLAIAGVGAAIVTFALPIVLWTQNVKGFSPTQSALLLAPMAIIGGGLSPLVGKNLHRWNTRLLAVVGLALFGLGIAAMGVLVMNDAAWYWLLIPGAVMGLGNAGMWAPLSISATYGLSRAQAGAGSGVYNAMRQLGAVIGSAAIAAVMASRITSEFADAGLGGGSGAGSGASDHAAAGGEAGASSGGVLPDMLHAPYAHAMGESLFLPAAIMGVAVIAALFLRNANARR
ncbi:MDR family MFS transporter [Brachybacterium halotolerans]|uniref:MDR family MFS transporter n=1 Tax=Brachybacterium halotolerans TaxID=2795215 RepID=UPI003898FAD0